MFREIQCHARTLRNKSQKRWKVEGSVKEELRGYKGVEGGGVGWITYLCKSTTRCYSFILILAQNIYSYQLPNTLQLWNVIIVNIYWSDDESQDQDCGVSYGHEIEYRILNSVYFYSKFYSLCKFSPHVNRLFSSAGKSTHHSQKLYS